MSLIDIMPREWSGEFALHSAADATADGSILDLKGFFGTLVLQVTGTFSGTITPKVSNDGTNFEERLATSGKTGVPGYSITAAGIYTIDVIGIKKFKAEITAYASGAITVIALGLPITAGMDNAAAKLISTLNGKIDAIVNGSTPATTTLTGSQACLSTEPKPAGQQNDTLLEYNPETKKTKVYKYISGDWREL